MAPFTKPLFIKQNPCVVNVRERRQLNEESPVTHKSSHLASITQDQKGFKGVQTSGLSDSFQERTQAANRPSSSSSGKTIGEGDCRWMKAVKQMVQESYQNRTVSITDSPSVTQSLSSQPLPSPPDKEELRKKRPETQTPVSTRVLCPPEAGSKNWVSLIAFNAHHVVSQ